MPHPLRRRVVAVGQDVAAFEAARTAPGGACPRAGSAPPDAETSEHEPARTVGAHAPPATAPEAWRAGR